MPLINIFLSCRGFLPHSCIDCIFLNAVFISRLRSVHNLMKWKIDFRSSCSENLRFWIRDIEGVRTKPAYLKDNGRLYCFYLTFLFWKKKGLWDCRALSHSVHPPVSDRLSMYLSFRLQFLVRKLMKSSCRLRVPNFVRALMRSPCYLSV
jgi:hypothetical protein